MKFLFLSTLLVVNCFNNLSQAQKIVSGKLQVSLKRANGNSPFPAIPDANQCGGSARLSELRVSGCKISNGICTVPAGDIVLVEIDFVAAKDARSLNLRIEGWLDDNGQQTIFDGGILYSGISKGGKYTVQISGKVDPSASGRKVRVKYHLTDGDDNSVRLCAEGEALLDSKKFLQGTALANLKQATGLSQLPVVPDASQCGGLGTLLELRSSGCRVTNGICQVPIDHVILVEIDYVAAKDARSLNLKVDIWFEDHSQETIFDGAVLNSGVERGGIYTIQASGKVDPGFAGKRIKIKYQVTDNDEGSLRLCVHAESFIESRNILQSPAVVTMKKATGNSEFPVVPDANQCGGPGKFAELRVLGCKLSNGICTAATGETVQIEIDYTAPKDSRSLNLKVEVWVDDNTQQTVFDGPILHSIVNKGLKYTVQISSSIDPSFSGRRVRVKYYVTDHEDGSLGLCVDAEANIEPKKIILAPLQVSTRKTTGLSQLPVVPDVTQCGGSGILTELRASSCRMSNGICSFPTNEPLQVEIDYIAAKDTKSLNLRVDIWVDENGQGTIFDGAIPNSASNKGKSNTIQIIGKLDSSISGKRVKVRYHVTDNDDGSQGLCVEADGLIDAKKIVQSTPIVALKKTSGNSKLPVVPEWTQCGGAAKVTEIRVLGCKVSDGLCTVPTGEIIQIEIDYTAAKDAKSLNLKIEVWVEENAVQVVFDGTVLNSAINKGGKYTIQISATLERTISGKKVQVRYSVRDNEEGSLRLCVDADGLIEQRKILQSKPQVALRKATGNSQFPVVPDASQCGGSGKLAEVRVQNCKLNNGFCAVPPGETIFIEIDYIAAKDAKSLSLRVDCWVDNYPEVLFDGAIGSSSVNKGGKYTIQVNTIVDKSMSGKTIKVRYQITDNEEGALRLCMEAEGLIESKRILTSPPLVVLRKATGGSKLPVVPVKQCGGTVKLQQLRALGCKMINGICNAPANEEVQVEIDATASEDLKSLSLRIDCWVDLSGPEVLFDGAILNSAVTKGTKYSLLILATVDSAIRGKRLKIKYNILDDEGNLRLCVEGESIIETKRILQSTPIVSLKKSRGNSILPLIPGSRQCGGTGKLPVVRAQGFKESNNICTINPGENTQVEIDYVAGESSKALNLKVELWLDGSGPENLFDGPIINSGVSRGGRYAIKISAVVDNAIIGKKVRVKYQITDNDDGSLRMCVEAEAQIDSKRFLQSSPVVVLKKSMGLSQLPVASSAKKCGGSGQLTVVRALGCKLGSKICSVPSGVTIPIEIEFVAMEDSKSLRLKIDIWIDEVGPENIYDGPVLHSSVSGGGYYTVRITGNIDQSQSGKRVKVKYQITDKRDGSLQLCVDADGVIS